VRASDPGGSDAVPVGAVPGPPAGVVDGVDGVAVVPGWVGGALEALVLVAGS
jgi:hypothetical protein